MTLEIETPSRETKRSFRIVTATWMKAYTRYKSQQPVLKARRFLPCLIDHAMQDKKLLARIQQKLDEQKYAYVAATPSELRTVTVMLPSRRIGNQISKKLAALVTQYRRYGRVRQYHVVDAILQEFADGNVVLATPIVKRYI